MDENNSAWKLATAARAALNNNPDCLDDAFKELKPSAITIARAYTLSLTTIPFSQSEANRLILGARLQVALMEEHVAAQRRMGRMINVLTGVLVVLTLVLVVFGGVEFLHLRSPPPVAAVLPPVVTPPDPRIAYDLREKCGRDAREWFKHTQEDNVIASKAVLTTQNEYRNHYSDKANRCYAWVLNTQMVTVGHDASQYTNTMLLVDVNENRELGRFFKNSLKDVPAKCDVEGQPCASQETWKTLADPYMTQ
jgi:hypothetical protein